MFAAVQKRGGPVPTREAEHVFAVKMKDIVKQICGDDCEIHENPKGKFDLPEYQVKFKDGWGFNISVDPNCVEIQTIPETAESIKKNMGRMERFIFHAANQIGLKPGEAAHLNIGVRSAFKDDPKAFAHFLADYSNRPALATGVFGRDFSAAPPMRMLNPDFQKAFQKTLDDVDSKKITTLEEIAKDINYKVYASYDPDYASYYRHNQAIGLKQLIKPEFEFMDMPFEFRAQHQPLNVQEYQLMTELMHNRISYTKTLKERPLYYRASTARLRENQLERAAHFQIYLEEMGQKWKKYELVVPKNIVQHLQSGTPTRIIEGRINWNDPKELNLFRDVMIDHFYLSPWTEERVQKIILEKPIPESAMKLILNDLAKQARENPEHAVVVKKFLAKIKGTRYFNHYPVETIEAKSTAPITKTEHNNHSVHKTEKFTTNQSATTPNKPKQSCIRRFLRGILGL